MDGKHRTEKEQVYGTMMEGDVK